jgi:Tol biopolymer transport system component/DNA-binding winged helix-turn-helix (wHTH) protein
MNEPFALRMREAPVELAREPDFDLGACRVRPSVCEVVLPSGVQRLEPRVMQVLVALARAGGAVVSRDDLIASCWGGRIVGEDAINRCIGGLRRVVAGEDAGVAVVTVPRVGFRLDVAASEAPPAGAEGAARRGGRPRAFAVVLVGAAALIVLLLGVLLPLRHGGWTVQDYRPFAADSLIELHPAFSPDGRSLAYASGPDIESRRILVRALQGGPAVRFSSGPGDDYAPAWSPSGDRIAFARAVTGEPCRILVQPARGGPERQVGACAHDERTRLAWLHDGSRLLFTDAPGADGASALRLLDLDTGQVSDLTHPDPKAGERDAEPVVSPSGHRVAFIRQGAGDQTELMILDLRTGLSHLVRTQGVMPNTAAWTPDGRDLIVGSVRAGDYALWLVPTRGGGEPRRLLTGQRAIGRITVSSSGRMAMEIDTARVNLARFGGPGGDIAAANGSDWSPDYAPDGSLAFVSDRGGGGAVWLARPGQAPVPAADLPFNRVSDVRWAPDGRRLAMAVARQRQAGIYVLDLATHKAQRLSMEGLDFGAPAWTPDGQALIAPVRDLQGWRLMRAPIDPRRQAVPASDYGWVSVRTGPGGLYGVRVDAPGVWRILPGGRRRLVAPQVTAIHPQDWTLWNGRVYALDRTRPGEADLYETPLAGGRSRLLGHLDHVAEGPGLTVDPTTGAMVYPRIVSDDSDIGLMTLKKGR